jgi:hypothetical protein
MFWSWFPVSTCLMAILIFVGAAIGQESGGLREQGQQPFLSGVVKQERQDITGHRYKSCTAAPNIKTPQVAGVNKNAKGTISKPGFGPFPRNHGRKQAFGAQVGISKSGPISVGYHCSGTTSFLDGYLLKSLHHDGSAKKKARSENHPKDDLRLKGKTSSKF